LRCEEPLERGGERACAVKPNWTLAQCQNVRNKPLLVAIRVQLVIDIETDRRDAKVSTLLSALTYSGLYKLDNADDDDDDDSNVDDDDNDDAGRGRKVNQVRQKEVLI
jgi:hypothetical protein